MPSPPLSTERLTMREWRLDDAPAAFEMYGDPEVVRFLGGDLPVADVDAQRAWLLARAPRWQEPGYDVWAVVERATERVIGTTMLKPIPGRLDRIEVGWHLARRVWGRGFATEAARAVVRYGFDARALSRIHALVVPENAASLAVVNRLGMCALGRSREYYDREELDVFALDRT